MTPTEMHIEALMEKIETLTAKVKRYEDSLNEILKSYDVGTIAHDEARAALNKDDDT